MKSKAMIACYVYTAKIVKELGLNLAGKVMLQFVVDEVREGDGALGTRYLLEKGVKAKAAIIGSPGEVVGIGHRGGYRFRLTTKGEQIPTASPLWQRGEKGKNAVSEMVKAVQAMQELELPYKAAKAFPGKKPVLTFPTILKGGTSIEMVPDECVAYGDVRLMPGNSDRQVRLRLEERLHSVSGLRFKLDDLVYVPAVEIDHKEEVVQILSEEVKAIRGEWPRVEGIGSWNSAWMYIQKDIPTIVQVPLEGGEYRGNHDWVNMNSLKEMTEIMVRTVIDYVGIKKEL
jgi:acetylornithine deacetylase/succinyl-diaminopimelate desuccinylase-like protein